MVLSYGVQICPTCQNLVPEGSPLCPICGSSLALPVGVELASGSDLGQGRYQISGVLGQGGFGITYRAQDQQLGRTVAIKELFVDGTNTRQGTTVTTSAQRSSEFETAKQAFLAEARTLARFTHPGVIRVFDSFQENGTAYYTMELLQGQTLEAALLEEGRLPEEKVLKIARQLAEALLVLHGENLLHRDIKPANIFLTQDGRAVLIDFGSARSFEQGQTVSHTRLVSPGYAPLEQYQGQGRFGPATDIYALSATLLHALSGNPPPDALTRLPQSAGGQGTPLPPFPPHITPGLQAALQQGLKLKASERPQDLGQFLKLLAHGQPGPDDDELPALSRFPSIPPPVPRSFESGNQRSGCLGVLVFAIFAVGLCLETLIRL